MTGVDPSADLEALLEPGEELEWSETVPGRGSYRVAGLVWVVAAAGVGLAGLLAGAWLLLARDAAGTAVAIGGPLVGVGGGAILAGIVALSVPVRRLVGWREFAGTDRRLIARGGLLRPSCESILWEDVEHVDVRYYHGVPRELAVFDRHGTPGRLLSAARADVRLRGITDIQGVFERIQAARDDRARSDGIGATTANRAPELPPTVEAALAPGEVVLHAADAPVWRRPARRRQRDVAAFALAGVLALGSVAATWLGYAWVTGGPPAVPVVPFLVGLVVDAAALAAYVRRRSDPRVTPVLTDRRILTHDGDAVRESLTWSETAGLALEGSRLVVLEEARGIETVPVRAIRGEFERPWMRVPAGEDAAALYWELRSLDGGSRTEAPQPTVVASPALD